MFKTLREPFSLLSSVALIRANPSKTSNEYLLQWILSPKGQYVIKDMMAGQAVKRITLNIIKNLKVIFPPHPEQKKIAKILSTWDEAIALTEKLITAKEKLKKGLMQQLLTGKKRFKEFEGQKWKSAQIKDLPILMSDGNYGEKYPKADEMSKEGIPFIRANNLKDGRIVWDDMKYINREKHAGLTGGHLKTNDILITSRGEIGKTAIVMDTFDGCNINAQIVLLRIQNWKILNPTFLLYMLQGTTVQKSVHAVQTGSALKQLPKGSLEKIKFPIPSMQEQEKIASVLSACDKEIQLINNKLEALKNQKKASCSDS